MVKGNNQNFHFGHLRMKMSGCGWKKNAALRLNVFSLNSYLGLTGFS